MSYKILVRDLPLKQTQRFAKDLVVRPIEKETSFFASAPKRFSKQIEVEAFDLVEQTDKNQHNTIAYIPFSYAYHFLPSCSPQTNHTKIKMRFQGELLDRQKDIREETFDILNRTHSILLCLHTGFGKTIYSLYLASKIGLKVVILCHRSIIINQWVNAIEQYLPSCSVGVWSSKMKPEKQPDILVANVLNICKWERERYADYGLLIIDEIHTMCTRKFSTSLLWFTPQYVIGLSATPFRADGMDRLIELYVGPEVVYKQMSRLFNAYRLKTNFEPTVEKLPDGTICWNSVLVSQASSPERNKLICDLARVFCDRVILILVKRKDHARVLAQMLYEAGEDVDMFLGTDKVVNYDCRILIATYSKGGVGFDHPRLDMLITAADVESNFMQYLGRVFRRDATPPIYIDLIDKLGMINKHATTRKQICIEAGGVVHEFTKAFPDFEFYRRFLSS